jgi:hypothetical protein
MEWESERKNEERDFTPTMHVDEFREMVREVLDQELGLSETRLGGRWEGGTLVLQPGDPSNKAKEIPLGDFFHKLVMVRDRLRVLEAKINGHAKLNDEDKVELQQYVTRIYGSLTSFNILFKEKDDQFRGTGGR